MLGLRIAALRRGKGWNQAELAHRLQISPSAVGMYEQGRREPALAMLVSIANLFGVTVDYLLTGRMETQKDAETAERAFRRCVEEACRTGERRPGGGLSRQELAMLVAAVLTEEDPA